MIAQLSEIIRRTEEEAPKNHGTDDGSEIEDKPQPKPELESGCCESEDTDTDDENALLTDRQSRKGQTGFAARKNSEAALKKCKSQQARRRYGRQEIVVLLKSPAPASPLRAPTITQATQAISFHHPLSTLTTIDLSQADLVTTQHRPASSSHSSQSIQYAT